jgi:hypothetical protein
MLQAGGVYDLERVEAFNGGDGSKVGESFDDLAEEDLSVGGIVDGHAYLVRAVFN